MVSNSNDKMNKLLFLSFIILLLHKCHVYSLYEDQAGRFEWVKRYLGSVEFAIFDESSTPARRVIVSTNQNVVAALGMKSGDIIWRHVLELPEMGRISAMRLQGHFVSIVFGNLIRTWNTITAALKDEIALSRPLNRPEAIINLVSFSKTGEEVFFVDVAKGTVGISSYDSISGSLIRNKFISASWVRDLTRCAITGDVLVCFDVLEKGLFIADLKSDSPSFTFNSISSLGISEGALQDSAGNPLSLSLTEVTGSDSHLLLKVGDKRKIIHVHKDGYHVVGNLKDPLAVSLIKDVIYSATQSLNTVTLQAEDASTSVEIVDQTVTFELPLQSGLVQSLAMYKFTRKDGGVEIRALVGCSDHSVHLISGPEVVWFRDEALASILTVESVDLPVSGIGEAYHQGTPAENGVISSFVYRISSQFHHLTDWLNSILRVTDDSDGSRVTLVRDRFNMHKLMVVVTVSGKILALDTRTGEAIWSVFVPFLGSFRNSKVLFFTQRTSAHYPSSPQCIIVARHKTTGNGLLFVFNPLTGEGIGEDNGIINLPYSLAQASILHHMDENFIKPLLMIDDQLTPHVFPRSGELIILQNKQAIFVHLAFPETSILKGYSFKDSQRGGLKLTEVWKCSLNSNGAIAGVFSKKASEKVHSQGRVLADRSVLYKYSNPNLVVVATFGQDELSKNTLTMHLVDTVTGSVLETVVHKRVFGPFHVVHSENWIVYTYYNEKSRRHEVTSLELFEGLTQSNVTAFSSFGDKATHPIVEKQSFILPQGVQSVGHTTTEKGITTKFILFALNTGSVLQMSKWFLDPRRPMVHAGPREEGLVPYMPELPLPPQEMINHNHTLPRVSAIYTAPTGLESTCLVFIYGLDVFYTRVFPSKMFDVLKDDFDHYLIIGALMSLTTAAIVTRKLSQRKALKQAWK